MTGYVSTIGGDFILEEMTDSTEYEPIDASYFFGEGADSAYVNPIMYPDASSVSRCAMLHDTDTEALLKMWPRVKGDNASLWTYILICIVMGCLVAFVILIMVAPATHHTYLLLLKSMPSFFPVRLIIYMERMASSTTVH